jgi:hypothetical protein
MKIEDSMNTEVATIPPKPLTVIERAAAVFAATPSEEDLRELVKKSATITEITNEAGKQQCHTARMVLKNTRLEIERVGEEGREDAVQTSKAIIARQKTLIGIPKPEEDRLAAIQKSWDDRIAAEKEAKIQAEIARVADIQERIVELRGCQTLSPSSGSALLLQHIADLEAIPVDDSFEEFRQSASDAKEAALSRLRGIHAAAVVHEAEQDRIKAEREELAKLRAEAVERDRLAREAQAKADAEAKAVRDAEAAAQAETLRLEREKQVEAARAHAAKIARENAERDAADEANRQRNEMAMQEIQAIHQQLMIADVGRAPYCKGGDLQSIDWVIGQAEKWELTEERFGVLYQTAVKTLERTLAALNQKRADLIARLANESARAENDRRALERAAELDRQAEEQRKANAVEAGRIAAERAQFEAEQSAAIEASKPKPRGRPGTKNPGREAIVQALAERYSVDAAVVRRWLKEIDWESEAA